MLNSYNINIPNKSDVNPIAQLSHVKNPWINRWLNPRTLGPKEMFAA